MSMETTDPKPCNSCGAPVYWLRHSRTGNPAPINAASDPGGNIVIDLAAGTYTMLPLDQRWERSGFIEVDPQTLHTNHFTDCPQRASWAKRGGRNDTRRRS